MAIAILPIGTAGLTFKAMLWRFSDGAVWNGSAYVATSGISAATLATYALAVSTLATNDPTTVGYYLTIPTAAGETPARVSFYETTYAAGDSEVYGADYQPTMEVEWVDGGRLDVILDEAAASNTTGDGAYSVAITVVDISDDPVENATVRLTLGATSYSTKTDENGLITFSCDAGTWTVGITGANYGSFTPVDLVVSGNTTQEYTLPAATYGTSYAENQDIYDIFGESNVLEWANMQELATTHEDYEDEIDRRMTASLAYAKEDMDDLLRGGGYDVPFVGAAITSTIKRCCALKAGAWLFEWRRDDDEDDRYNNMEKKADRLIEQIRRDVRRFDTSLQTVKGTRAPSAE